MHRALAKLDTTGSAAELARQIRSMPERNIAGKVATFARKPIAAETLKKSTGK